MYTVRILSTTHGKGCCSTRYRPRRPPRGCRCCGRGGMKWSSVLLLLWMAVPSETSVVMAVYHASLATTTCAVTTCIHRRLKLGSTMNKRMLNSKLGRETYRSNMCYNWPYLSERNNKNTRFREDSQHSKWNDIYDTQRTIHCY